MSDEISAAPAGLRRQARRMNLVNVPMRRLLALPFATPLSRSLMLLHLTGRRTGRHYRQPVSYVRDGEAMLTPGGGRWKLNLEAGRPVRIRVGGCDVLAEPEIIGDLDGVADGLRTIDSLNPRATRFIPIERNAAGDFDRAEVDRAVAHGFRIVRWRVVGPVAERRSPGTSTDSTR